MCASLASGFEWNAAGHVRVDKALPEESCVPGSLSPNHRSRGFRVCKSYRQKRETSASINSPLFVVDNIQRGIALVEVDAATGFHMIKEGGWSGGVRVARWRKLISIGWEEHQSPLALFRIAHLARLVGSRVQVLSRARRTTPLPPLYRRHMSQGIPLLPSSDYLRHCRTA